MNKLYATNLRKLLEKRLEDEKQQLPDVPGYWDEYAKKILQLSNLEIDELIDFINTECTGKEFVFLAEVFPEITEITQSKKFVECIKQASKRFPKETSEYNLLVDIDEAENLLSEELTDEKK